MYRLIVSTRKTENKDRFENYRHYQSRGPILKFLYLHPTEANMLWIVDAILCSRLPYRWMAVEMYNYPAVYRSPENATYVHHPALLFYKQLLGVIRQACAKMNPKSREYYYTQSPPKVIVDIVNMMYYLSIPISSHFMVWVAIVALSTEPAAMCERQGDGTFVNTVTREHFSTDPDDAIFFRLAKSALRYVGCEIIPKLHKSESVRVRASEMLVYSFATMQATIFSVRDAFRLKTIKIPFFQLDWALHCNILDGVRAASRLIFSGRPEAGTHDENLIIQTLSAKHLDKFFAGPTNRERLISARPVPTRELREEDINQPLDGVKRPISSATQDRSPEKYPHENIKQPDPNDFILQELLDMPPPVSSFYATFPLTKQFVHKYIINVISKTPKVKFSPLGKLLQSYKQFVYAGFTDFNLCIKLRYDSCECYSETETARFSSKSPNFSRLMTKSQYCSMKVIPQMAASVNQATTQPSACASPLLVESFIQIYVNEEEIPCEFFENRPAHKMSVADFAIGTEVKLGDFAFRIDRIDAKTKEWYSMSLQRIQHIRRRIEEILVCEGKRAVVCQYRYFEEHSLQNCAITIREASSIMLALYGQISDCATRLSQLQ